MSDTTTLPTSAEAFERCVELGDKFHQIRSIVPDRRSDTWDADRRRARDELLDANTEFDMAVRMEAFTMQRAAWEYAQANPPQGDIRGPLAAFAQLGGEYRSPGEIFVEARAGRSSLRIDEGDEIEVRNLLTGSSIGTSGSNVFAPVGTPLYTPQTNRQRRLFVRDLLSVQQTGLNSVPYIRELNAATNETGATAVSEASAKPEVTMQFESADAPIRKLAAWIQATMEALEDAPTLRGYINTRLAYMMLLREEAQVIGVGAGGGNSPNIKGILDFTGAGLQTASTQEFYAVVATSIGKIEAVDGDADGVVVHPTDFWAAVADRHSEQFDGQAYGANAPFGTPTPTAWGLPVVRSRSITAGTCLVGSFGLGATLFEREGPTIRTTDSHASLFISNTWVILAEERVGLAVHRPDFFVLATISAPS